MKVDYIVVGQGLCGTLLSRRLIMEGRSVLVVDDCDPAAACRVAGGIINPVTGKRLVRSWMTTELLPFAQKEYAAISEEMDIAIGKPINILDFHATADARSLFDEKSIDEDYLETVADTGEWQQFFRYNYGIGRINKCQLIDMQLLITAWRQKLLQGGQLLEERFDVADCVIEGDYVMYEGVSAGKVIFCDGPGAAGNPWFDRLPWSKDKGEALIVSIPGLPDNFIYKQGISIVPWKDGLFWVGASHDWKYTSPLPTPEYKSRVMESLDYWLRLPYTVVDHLAALRPANFDRKPFAGLHPVYPQIGLFNGMGGKGCSMAPYFAAQLGDFLTKGTPMLVDVDVRRYTKILSR